MIPSTAFSEILLELEARPIPVNVYRKKVGEGRSQAFGLVNRRCLPADYSRQCWLRPKLFGHLLAFGAEHVRDISWNAITVNQNYCAGPHRDKHNIGSSFLVAFGDYSEGGALNILEGDLSGSHDIRYQPVITDFSKVLHSVSSWKSGDRYSLVFYLLNTGVVLPPPSVKEIDGKLTFFRGDVACRGLPHPLKGRKKL